MPKFNPHFLVISLGNPGQYADSLHSAGHAALRSLHKAIVKSLSASSSSSSTASYDTPPPSHPEQQQHHHHHQQREQQEVFSYQKYGKKACWGSRGTKYTLLQSPTLMNVSGRFALAAWEHTLEGRMAEARTERDQQSSLAAGGERVLERLRPRPALVVVHDDLEEAFGTVKVRRWSASHRGHNGIKSINSTLRAQLYPGAVRWARVSVGIGRPESRAYGDVSDYVLSPMTAHQKAIIDAQVGSKILACLDKMEVEWKKDYETSEGAAAAQ